ncbi:MAG: ATPase, T2SS/T4P/T4SS family [Actinomycetota bacterium]
MSTANDELTRLADRIGSDVRAVATSGELDDVDRLVDAEVTRHRPLADDVERQRLADAIRSRLGGLDRLEPWLADPDVDEVLVSRGAIWVERRGVVERVEAIDGDSTRRVVERVLAPLGRRLDRSSPIVDARLPDGSRVCAVIEPVAVDGPVLSVRRFAEHARSLDDFLDGTAGDDAATIRSACVEALRRRCNVVVSGATSSGKTSLLGALLALADPADRIIVLEDTRELPCAAPHIVRLEARPETVDGPAPITVEQLVRTALRLRPDRLVVGEVRGDEVLALVQAMNTGHDGSFSTVHANSPEDALLRLESLVVRAAPRWPLSAVRHTLARSIDVVVHVGRRGPDRMITQVAEVVAAGHDAAPGPLEVRSVSDGRTLGRTRR